MPVKNLSRLLTLSRQAPDLLSASRDYEREPAWTDSLLDAYAHALLNRVEEIAQQGLLREYGRQAKVTSFPRGRILAATTVRHLHGRGLAHKVATSHFERGPDNTANRCLKYALWFVAMRLSSPMPMQAERRRLLDRIAPIYELFGEVPLDHSLDFLGDGLVTGSQRLPSLRSYYRPALDVAAAIVREHGVKLESREGAVELPSLALNMSRLFEHYLRNVLRTEAPRRGWEHEVLDGNSEGRSLLFDERPSEEATPDIVIRDQSADRCPALVEVKNVPVRGTHSDRSSIEQAVTYGVSYRCNRVVLVHPRVDPNGFCGLRPQGRMEDLAIYQYVFDLAADPIEAEEERFAAGIEEIVASDSSWQVQL